MDKIHIKDLEIYAYHGVNPEENKLGQKYLVSIDIELDFSVAAKNDDLTHSINYADVCKLTEKVFLEKKYKLIEKCANVVAENILLEYPQSKMVTVKIKKPWAPIGSHLKYAAVETSEKWSTAYLGLGSNIGDKEAYLKNALKLIESQKTKVVAVSSFYVTTPVGYVDQDDFLNCACQIQTMLSPTELMDLCLETETKLNRERIIHWGPRTIDIDVLLYDHCITSSEHIVLPHPQMTERLFVLEPLAEIAPYVVHPLLNRRIVDIKNELKKTQII